MTPLDIIKSVKDPKQITRFSCIKLLKKGVYIYPFFLLLQQL